MEQSKTVQTGQSPVPVLSFESYPAQPYVQGVQIPFNTFDRAGAVQSATYARSWLAADRLGLVRSGGAK